MDGLFLYIGLLTSSDLNNYYTKTEADDEFVSSKDTVTDLSSTSIVLDNVAANTNYYYDTLTSLTIVANDNSSLESNIFFVAGETIDFSIPQTLKTSGDYELQPNKAYRLSICDNILTVEVVENHVLTPVVNLFDNPEEITEGYWNRITQQKTIFNDFCQITVEVEPNQELYLDAQPGSLNIAYFDENKSWVYGDNIVCDENGKFTTYNDSHVKYLSIPFKASDLHGRTLSTTPIKGSYGNVPLVKYTMETGNLSTKTPTTVTDKWGKVHNNSTAVQTSNTCWHVNFVEADEMYVCGDGMWCLGINPTNGDVICIGITNGKLYTMTTGSIGEAYTEHTQFTDFTLPQTQFTVANSLKKNSTMYKQVYGPTSIQFRDQTTDEIVQELTYADIDAHLTGGLTYSSFSTHAIGSVWCDSTTAYPYNYTICAWKSTLPVVQDDGQDEPETNPDLVDTWWRGKEWYAYGTSMTDATYNGYAVKLAAMTGMNIHNYGKGGSGIIPSLHPSDNIKTRVMRTSDGKANADLVTVEVIPNDMSGTLGNPTDTGDETFLGNLNQIIQYLQENCPKAQIVILSATRSRRSLDGQTEYGPTSQNATNWLAWEDGTKEVCRRNCVQYWQGGTNCGLGYHRVKAATSGNQYVQDQIHLTDVGAENLAYYFLNQLKNLPLWHTTYDL